MDYPIRLRTHRSAAIYVYLQPTTNKSINKRIVKRISYVNVRVFKILKVERLKFKKLFL